MVAKICAALKPTSLSEILVHATAKEYPTSDCTHNPLDHMWLHYILNMPHIFISSHGHGSFIIVPITVIILLHVIFHIMRHNERNAISGEVFQKKESKWKSKRRIGL